MRGVTSAAVLAFMEVRPMQRDNTAVTVEGRIVRMWLHGSCIARRRGTRVEINPCGYLTKTTLDRLRGLVQVFGARLWLDKKRLFLSDDNGEREIEADEWTVIVPGSAAEEFIYSLEDLQNGRTT